MNIEKYQKVKDAMTKVEDELEYFKWMEEIPEIPMEKLSKYKIQIIPPFFGAIVRYRFINPVNENNCSVLLDGYGFFGFTWLNKDLGHEPYWEVYSGHGDNLRILLKDTKRLIDTIIRCMEKEEE